MSQLVDEDVTVDPHFDEDFLLTHRTFVPSSQVMEFLLRMMTESQKKDKVSSFSINFFTYISKTL